MNELWIAVAAMALYTLLVFGVTALDRRAAPRPADPVDEHAAPAIALTSPPPLVDAVLTETEQSTFDHLIRTYYSTDAYPQHYWPPVVPGPEES